MSPIRGQIGNFLVEGNHAYRIVARYHRLARSAREDRLGLPRPCHHPRRDRSDRARGRPACAARRLVRLHHPAPQPPSNPDHLAAHHHECLHRRDPHQQPASSIQLVTDTAALPVVLDSPDAIRVQWLPGRGRTCDGRTQDNGRSCACPAALVLRRAAAKQGHGCQPSAKIRFRLLADPALGRFAFTSTDWSFVELAAEARTGLHDTGEPTAAWLSLRRTLHALRSGWELAYTRPVLVMLDDAR
jgi:hypothetical protein